MQYQDALHQDEIGVTSRIIEALKQKKGNVVIEGYFGNREERQKVLSEYRGYKRCIFLDISVEESIRRENRNRHPCILRNAFHFFESPTFDEGWDEIIIIRGDKEEHFLNPQKI